MVLCICSILRADLQIRDITPDKAKQLGWKVEVHEKEDYVQFTVQPQALLLSQGRTAHLSVWHERKLIISCILGFHKRRHGDRYEFAVSKQYFADSVFELGQDATSLTDDSESYRIRLSKFISSKKKESGPQQRPERDK